MRYRKIRSIGGLVIASEAKQSSKRMQWLLDCFVAEFIIGPAKGRTRWLLATTRNGDQELAFRRGTNAVASSENASSPR
jgi:hypothetical protein